MKNEKILLIDSDDSIRHVILDVLSIYSVTPALNPVSALKRLSEEPFDLDLINLSFNQMDSLFSKIKESHGDIPCLLLISPEDVEKGIEFLKTGMYGFILKPFTRQEMLNTVEESLWRSRIINENVRLKLLMPLFEMTQRLLERPKLGEIVQHIFTLFSRETGADLVSLSLRENELIKPAFLEVKTTQVGFRNDITRFIRWVEQRFSQLEKPLLITGFEENLRDVAEQMNIFQYSSLLVYPLNSKFEKRGVLISGKTCSKNHFFARDKELFSIIGHQLAIILENYELIEELENSHFESLKALASAIEAKDAYTSGHCDRLVDYSFLFGEKLNLTQDERKQLRYGAALHDIG